MFELKKQNKILKNENENYSNLSKTSLINQIQPNSGFYSLELPEEEQGSTASIYEDGNGVLAKIYNHSSSLKWKQPKNIFDKFNLLRAKRDLDKRYRDSSYKESITLARLAKYGICPKLVKYQPSSFYRKSNSFFPVNIVFMEKIEKKPLGVESLSNAWINQQTNRILIPLIQEKIKPNDVQVVFDGENFKLIDVATFEQNKKEISNQELFAIRRKISTAIRNYIDKNIETT